MKICVYGAGAVGGFLAGVLAGAGHEVSVIVRGDTLRAIRDKGLRVEHAGRAYAASPAASDDPGAIGPVDCVIVTVKGPALTAIGPAIGPLLRPDTPVVFAMNGIPWWYDYRLPAAGGVARQVLDPEGLLHRAIGPERAIGCVVDCPTHVAEPGLVRNNRPGPAIFTLGEPAGPPGARLAAIAGALAQADALQAPQSGEIRRDIWVKLLVNLSRSPLAVLTGSDEMALSLDADCNAIAEAMMREAHAVAGAHGIRFEFDFAASCDPANRIVHRPSMLQDWDQGRAMEIDSIVGAVQAFARAADLATPAIDVVGALLRRKAAEAGTWRPHRPAGRAA